LFERIIGAQRVSQNMPHLKKQDHLLKAIQ